MPLFDLTPTDEQQMTRDVIQRFAKDEIAPIARATDEAAALPEDFLAKTVDLGLNFMPVPESMGGVGGSGFTSLMCPITCRRRAHWTRRPAAGVTRRILWTGSSPCCRRS